MTMPMEYRQASADFDRFMLDARDETGLTTTNQTFTTVQAVLQAFRCRLGVADALAFASVLPPVLRGLFVADWDIAEQRLSFTDRTMMMMEVKALRPDHNLSPDTAIADVARALRKNIDNHAFDKILSRLPPGAAGFWSA